MSVAKSIRELIASNADKGFGYQIYNIRPEICSVFYRGKVHDLDKTKGLETFREGGFLFVKIEDKP